MEIIKKRKVFFQLEQVLDTWSLLFCIGRHIVANNNKKLTNKDYELIVNQSVEQGAKNICDKYLKD